MLTLWFLFDLWCNCRMAQRAGIFLFQPATNAGFVKNMAAALKRSNHLKVLIEAHAAVWIICAWSEWAHV